MIRFNVSRGIATFVASATLFCGLSASAGQRPTPLTLERLDYDTYIHLTRPERVEVLRAIREFYVGRAKRMEIKLSALHVASLWPDYLSGLRAELFPEAFAEETTCTKIEGDDKTTAWVNTQLDCNVAGHLTCMQKVGNRYKCGANDTTLKGECTNDGEVQCDKILFPPKAGAAGPLCAKLSGTGENNPTTFCDKNAAAIDQNSETLKAEDVIARLKKMKDYCKEENPKTWEFNKVDCELIAKRLEGIQLDPNQSQVAQTNTSTCLRRHLHLCNVSTQPSWMNSPMRYSIQIDDKTHKLVACEGATVVKEVSLKEMAGDKVKDWKPEDFNNNDKVRGLLAEIKSYDFSITRRAPAGAAAAGYVKVKVPLGADAPPAGHDVCETKVGKPLQTRRANATSCTFTKDAYTSLFRALNTRVLPGTPTVEAPDQIVASCAGASGNAPAVTGLQFQKAGEKNSFTNVTLPWSDGGAWSSPWNIGNNFRSALRGGAHWGFYAVPGCNAAAQAADRTKACVLYYEEVARNAGPNGEIPDKVNRAVTGFTGTAAPAAEAK